MDFVSIAALLFTYHDPAISSFIWFCLCVQWIHKISITKESNEAEILQSDDYEIGETDSGVATGNEDWEKNTHTKKLEWWW